MNMTEYGDAMPLGPGDKNQQSNETSSDEFAGLTREESRCLMASDCIRQQISVMDPYSTSTFTGSESDTTEPLSSCSDSVTLRPTSSSAPLSSSTISISSGTDGTDVSTGTALCEGTHYVLDRLSELCTSRNELLQPARSLENIRRHSELDNVYEQHGSIKADCGDKQESYDKVPNLPMKAMMPRSRSCGGDRVQDKTHTMAIAEMNMRNPRRNLYRFTALRTQFRQRSLVKAELRSKRRHRSNHSTQTLPLNTTTVDSYVQTDDMETHVDAHDICVQTMSTYDEFMLAPKVVVDKTVQTLTYAETFPGPRSDRRNVFRVNGKVIIANDRKHQFIIPKLSRNNMCPLHPEQMTQSSTPVTERPQYQVKKSASVPSLAGSIAPIVDYHPPDLKSEDIPHHGSLRLPSISPVDTQTFEAETNDSYTQIPATMDSRDLGSDESAARSDNDTQIDGNNLNSMRSEILKTMGVFQSDSSPLPGNRITLLHNRLLSASHTERPRRRTGIHSGRVAASQQADFPDSTGGITQISDLSSLFAANYLPSEQLFKVMETGESSPTEKNTPVSLPSIHEIEVHPQFRDASCQTNDYDKESLVELSVPSPVSLTPLVTTVSEEPAFSRNVQAIQEQAVPGHYNDKLNEQPPVKAAQSNISTGNDDESIQKDKHSKLPNNKSKLKSLITAPKNPFASRMPQKSKLRLTLSKSKHQKIMDAEKTAVKQREVDKPAKVKNETPQSSAHKLPSVTTDTTQCQCSSTSLLRAAVSGEQPASIESSTQSLDTSNWTTHSSASDANLLKVQERVRSIQRTQTERANTITSLNHESTMQNLYGIGRNNAVAYYTTPGRYRMYRHYKKETRISCCAFFKMFFFLCCCCHGITIDRDYNTVT